MRRSYTLNYIVHCESNANSSVDLGDDDFKGFLDINEDLMGNDILLLTDTDISGASLDGKHPSELSVVQLKR